MVFRPKIIRGGLDGQALDEDVGKTLDFEDDVLAFDFNAENFFRTDLNNRVESVMNLCEEREIVHSQAWSDYRALFNAHVLSDKNLVNAVLEGDYNRVNQNVLKYACFVGEALERALEDKKVPRLSQDTSILSPILLNEETILNWDPLKAKIEAIQLFGKNRSINPMSENFKNRPNNMALATLVMSGEIDEDQLPIYLKLAEEYKNRLKIASEL